METSTALPLDWEESHLARELKTFLTHQPGWLVMARDKYVLIKGDEVIGFYDRQDEALTEGYRRIRREPFMVQRIQEDFDTYYFGGSGLGLGREKK